MDQMSCSTKESGKLSLTPHVHCVHIDSEGSHFLDCVHGCADQDKSVICTLKELGSGGNLQGNE